MDEELSCEEVALVNPSISMSDMVVIAICSWAAALSSLFIPILGIPFGVVALIKAYNTKSTLCKVATTVVMVFVAMLVIYWMVTIVANMQEMLEEIVS